MRSMTGFGKAQRELNNKRITVEIRSLNSKQLDLNLRIPALYREKEAELRSDIAKQLERGKIDLGIGIEYTGEAQAISLNKALARNYYTELKALAAEINEPTTHYLPLILKMPDVFKTERQELDEEEWNDVKKTVDEALKQIIIFRDDEGKVLEQDLQARISIILNLLTEVEALDGKRIPSLKGKIEKDLAEYLDPGKLDQNRLEQEMIYYIEKLDITEEKVRLKTHCDYFFQTMKEKSGGRKLGFISQEIGREINTIGSKANNADIQKQVVQMKDELEKIKEQLSNIL